MRTATNTSAGFIRKPHLLGALSFMVALSMGIILGVGAYAFFASSLPGFIPPPETVLTEGILEEKSLQYYVGQVDSMIDFMTMVLGVLLAALIIILLVLVMQMRGWNDDRKRLMVWRETGFVCERLEFLPANRLRINNLEIQLNRTQMDSFKKLVSKRQEGSPLHALDIGDHGVQAIKRLREELGAKFLEQAFIKARKGEGYWLEVELDKIKGLPHPEDEVAAG